MIPIRLQHRRLVLDDLYGVFGDCDGERLLPAFGTSGQSPSVPNVPAPPWPLVAFPGGQGLLFPASHELAHLLRWRCTCLL